MYYNIQSVVFSCQCLAKQIAINKKCLMILNFSYVLIKDLWGVITGR